MKSVLISIRPEWCELIASGKKTIEVRKSRPKLETPFKVYIYCTKDKHGWFDFGKKERLDGKVIGEFVCDRIDPAVIDKSKSISRESCVPLRDLWEYASPKSLFDLYGWHISDLKIYDKPKALSVYGTKHKCNLSRKCTEHGFLCAGYCKLTRPPQSWCYVEELKNG